MGRLLNELIAESIMAEAANPANPANLEGRVPRVSQESQDSQGARTSEMRAHLLALCADEYLPRRLVNALPDSEVAACIEYGDAEVRTYLHALERGRVVDAGQVPPEYTATVHCARCGPVLLWPSCPQLVKACPWCFRRQGGQADPSPHGALRGLPAIPAPQNHCRRNLHRRTPNHVADTTAPLHGLDASRPYSTGGAAMSTTTIIRAPKATWLGGRHYWHRTVTRAAAGGELGRLPPPTAHRTPSPPNIKRGENP